MIYIFQTSGVETKDTENGGIETFYIDSIEGEHVCHGHHNSNTASHKISLNKSILEVNKINLIIKIKKLNT